MDRRNRPLERLLTGHGYSHTGLAAAVNLVSEEITGRPGDCTDRRVRCWISGEVRWPSIRYLLALQQIFGMPAEAMGFVPRGRDSANLPTPPARPTDPQRKGTGGVQRRQIVAASAAGAVAVALGIDDTPARGRLSMADVARVEERISRLDAHFAAIGGGPLVDAAAHYIDRLREALDGCTYGDRVSQALHSSISGLYAVAGWAAHDSGSPSQAGRLHGASLQSAMLAADPAATARAWSNLALQARTEGRHRESVQINRAALDDRRARGNPRIAALLHARLAIGQARIGDRRAVGRSLLAAERAYDRVPDGPAPAWLQFLSAAELSGLAAIAHQAMGQYGPAEAATTRALALLPPPMRRNRAYYTTQLAELQLAQGDHERAAATAGTVDASSLDSNRISGRLDRIRQRLDKEHQ